MSCILLLVQRQFTVLQTTLIGGILANILFVLGASLVAGSWNRAHQSFNFSAAHASCNLLSLAATSLLIPTMSNLLGQSSGMNLVKQSRGASVILIVVYLLYLVYQLKTHRKVYMEESEKVPTRTNQQSTERAMVALAQISVAPGSNTAAGDFRRHQLRDQSSPHKDKNLFLHSSKDEDEDDTEYEPQLHIAVAVVLFAVSTALLYFSIDYVVNSIDELTTKANVPAMFIGLVLLLAAQLRLCRRQPGGRGRHEPGHPLYHWQVPADGPDGDALPRAAGLADGPAGGDARL